MLDVTNLQIITDTVDPSTEVVVVDINGNVHALQGMVRNVVAHQGTIWYTELNDHLRNLGYTEDDICTDPTAQPVVALVISS